MSNNVGSLNATLTLSAYEFANGLKQSTVDMKNWETEVVQSARRANAEINKVGPSGGGIGKGVSNSVQQISYGLQDFTSQFDGTMKGLSRGLNGVSNNLQQAAQYAPGYWKLILGVGAVALPFVPTMIEWATATKDVTKSLDENSEALGRWRKEMADAKKLRDELLAGGTGELNSRQGDKRSELDMLTKQRRELEAGIRRDEEIVRNTDEERRRLDNKGGISSFFGAPMISDNGAGARLEAMRKELAKATEEANKLNIELTQAERLRPEVEKVEAGRDKIEAFRERQELMAKGREEIERLERKGLESYGDEHSKLMAKQLRERTELEDATRGLREQSSALAMLDDQQSVERQRLKISDLEKSMSKLGPDAKASAGLDVASAEGIRAINNAISGRGENSMMKEQLEIEKRQLIALEAMASGKAEGKAMMFAAKGAGDGIELGSATSMGEMNRDGSFVRIGNDGATVSGANPEATQGRGRRQRVYRGPDQSAVWDRVEAARAARELGGQQTADVITKFQAERAKKQQADSDRLWAGAGGSKTQGVEDDGIKLLKRIADKPTMKVVALSGG